MTSGIETKEIEIGAGPSAERGKVAVVHVRGFLSRGEKKIDTYAEGKPWQIHLGKRQVFPGLEKGLEGMRVGGIRELEISPHLAYGEQGLPGTIPPHAVLRLEVELLEVREPGVVKPNDYPPGKQLLVMRSGEMTRNVSGWQLGIWESGQCGISIRRVPSPGATWRYAQHTSVPIQLSPDEIKAILEEVLAMEKTFPSEIVKWDDVWSDTSEKANSISRDRSNIPCVSVSLWEQGEQLVNFYLRENSHALLNARFFQIAMKSVEQ